MKKGAIISLLLLLSGCTFSRMIAYKMPNTEHHTKFKSERVEASENPFSFTELPYRALPELELWVEEKLSDGYNTVEEFMVATGSTSLLVIRNDSILYENYFNGHFRDKPAIVFSISKAITTTLVSQALEEGYLQSVHQKVAEFIPEFGEDERRDISINHLMQMTSGLDFEDKSTVFKLAKAYYSKNVNEYLKKIKLAHEPGTFFAYKSLDTQVLAYCLEVMLSKADISISSYMQEKIWEPIGAEYDALVTLDKENGNPRMYGGVAACTRDLAKFGKLFLQNGQWDDGNKVVTKEWVTSTKSRRNDDRYWAYSNGWWLDSYVNGDLFEMRDFYAAGFKGQVIYVNPDYNMIIVRQGNSFDKIIWPYLISRLASVIQKPLNCRPDQLKPDIAEGTYIEENGKQKVEIKFNGKRWQASGLQIGKLDLLEECPQTLFNDKNRIRITLHKVNDVVVGLYVDDYQTVTHYLKQ